MAKTKIEWADITLNPVRGKCPHGCGYCYAEGIRQRFKQSEEMTFHPKVIEQMLKLPEPRTIFWGSMFDLFAKDVPSEWLHQIFEACISEVGQQHNHVFLTKNSNRYRHFMKYKLGKSFLYFGASTTGSLVNFDYAIDFLSVEPFVADYADYTSDYIADMGVESLMIGGLTGRGDPYKHTSYSAVVNLVEAAFKAGKKVFIKDNIKEYIPYPVGLGMNIGKHVSNFRQLPWDLYTKSKTAGVE